MIKVWRPVLARIYHPILSLSLPEPLATPGGGGRRKYILQYMQSNTVLRPAIQLNVNLVDILYERHITYGTVWTGNK